MKIIQSFWSKPSFEERSVNNDSRALGGWTAVRYYYMSWALSCLRLLEHYDQVELYTDKNGKELLIDRLGLPYTKVHTDLDCLNCYNGHLWTIGKIYVYGLQRHPFIHIDSDIFISNIFHERIHNAPIVAQNLETSQSYYHPVVDKLLKYFNLPGWLREELEHSHVLIVSNTGIVGGTEVDFIRSYTSEAFRIIDQNKHNLDKINIGAFSVLIEQYLLYSMAVRNKVTIEYLIKDHLDYTDKDLILIKVHKAPHNVQFIHPLGPYKQYPHIFNAVDLALRTEYPEVYYKIIRLLRYNEL